jgi:serine/threonine protein kinase
VDDAVINQGLGMIRKLWDAGIAHRDIKPGNLMVRSGELLLIDVAFAEVRPSPWRQAVDLGNMMLLLALRSGPQRVYRRALAYFTPGELSEAFAATCGVASPTQLRALIRRDPRDLLGQFRALAPPRKPIIMQRWSARRVALAAAAIAIILFAVVYGQLLFAIFIPSPRDLSVKAPYCGAGRTTTPGPGQMITADGAALRGPAAGAPPQAGRPVLAHEGSRGPAAPQPNMAKLSSSVSALACAGTRAGRPRGTGTGGIRGSRASGQWCAGQPAGNAKGAG